MSKTEIEMTIDSFLKEFLTNFLYSENEKLMSC